MRAQDTADSALIRQVKDDLRDRTLLRVVWVADRGFTSAENRRYLRRGGTTTSSASDSKAIFDDAVAVLEDAAQIPAHRLAQDVAIEKILAALAATGDELGNPPATP